MKFKFVLLEYLTTVGRQKERATTTASSLEAEQDSEAQTRFEAASKQSNDPPLSRVNTLRSGEDSMKLKELLNLLLPILVYAARHILTAVRHKLMLPGINSATLKKVEDASKQGRKIDDLDADAEVTLVDETQEMNDDNLLFDTDVLEEQEKEVAEKEVSTADPVTTAGEVVTTTNVEATTANAPTTTIDELTLAQTLIEIKAAKPKAITSAATTTTTIRPKARGVAKDKGKAIMVEPERPLKKKDQVALDEEMARNLEAQMQAELIEEERLARQKEEESNIALIES
ncbi:hypothetical protein Tco_0695534 [Tanacetum coccineum]